MEKTLGISYQKERFLFVKKRRCQAFGQYVGYFLSGGEKTRWEFV